MDNDQVYDLTPWRKAKTLHDMGELMAQWLEGSIKYHPGYAGDSPESETEPLITILAAYNRAGFITTISQPGIAVDEQGYGQRAWVQGFASKEIAKRVASLGLYTDLLVVVIPVDVELNGYMIPVTIDEFRPFSWGGSLSDEEFTAFIEACSPEAEQALLQALQINIIDLQWGRDSYLWGHVSAILTGEGIRKPYPDLSLDDQFYY